MKTAPTASQLLNVWEQGRQQTPAWRAFSLLALATSPASDGELPNYTIGRRDRELLNLREKIFGPQMKGAATCPGCKESVEVEFSVPDICTAVAGETDQLHEIQFAGYAVRFRLPNCDDLNSIDPHAGTASAKSELLKRCVVMALLNGQPASAAALPGDVVGAVSQRMAELDPQGDIQLALTCPNCELSWVAPLDIVSFFWSELHVWAERLLREVHELAMAYGWREADILALSAWRRRFYLERIGA